MYYGYGQKTQMIIAFPALATLKSYGCSVNSIHHIL